jgi:hypothetical protein
MKVKLQLLKSFNCKSSDGFMRRLQRPELIKHQSINEYQILLVQVSNNKTEISDREIPHPDKLRLGMTWQLYCYKLLLNPGDPSPTGWWAQDDMVMRNHVGERSGDSLRN